MTRDDLDKPATRRDVLSVLDERQVATRHDLDTLRDELRRHFDVVAEQFKSDFRNLFDWTESTTSTLGTRVDRLETELKKRRRR